MTQPFTHFPWHHHHDMHHIRCDRPGALLPPPLAPVIELFPLKGQFRKVTAIKPQLFELLKLVMQKHFAQGLCLQFFPLFPPRLMGVGREVWWESFPVSESLCECPGSFSRASSLPSRQIGSLLFINGNMWPTVAFGRKISQDSIKVLLFAY